MLPILSDREPAAIPVPHVAGAIDLAPQQREALARIRGWVSDPRSPQVFRLFGYAGTGKTTLARHIVNSLGLAENTIYAAPTGKAAHVLQSKGCEPASTIHGLIYKPRHQNTDELDRLIAMRAETSDPVAIEELIRLIRAEQRRMGRLRFDRREASDLSGARLLVLDEASMVNDEMARDLLSFGTQVLVLGDPAQLPPVFGNGFFTSHRPDYLLTEIHRSALDSPVTRIATTVRQASASDRRFGVHGRDGDSGRVQTVRWDDLFAFDVTLTWRNATRWAVIDAMRAAEGRLPKLPSAGDRITVLANNRDVGVFNGQGFEVLDCEAPRRTPDRYLLDVLDDTGEHRSLTVWANGFFDRDSERLAARNGRQGEVIGATFGQALTVHRSQGSQWDRVLVLDESAGVRSMAARTGGAARAHAEARSWMYTACTRAAKRVAISTQGVVS